MAAEPNIDLASLPQDVRDKLAELELELSEGKLKSIISILAHLT